jgi:hypothetical protein
MARFVLCDFGLSCDFKVLKQPACPSGQLSLRSSGSYQNQGIKALNGLAWRQITVYHLPARSMSAPGDTHETLFFAFAIGRGCPAVKRLPGHKTTIAASYDTAPEGTDAYVLRTAGTS